MRKFLLSLVAISTLFACNPLDHNNSSGGRDDRNGRTALSVTVGADNISANSVVLRGKANLGSTVATDLRVGFQYSLSPGILPSNSKSVSAENVDANYNYSTYVKGLTPATTYYYRSFVSQNGVETHGEVKSFKTDEYNVKVESVSLDKTEDTIYHIGNTLPLKASILPENASNKSVEWSSNNTKVAIVDNSGKVTAIGGGKATITVRTKDQGKTASCLITVLYTPYSAIAGEVVDLGLSVKWSSFNLGATKPEEYGDYFAWGETVPNPGGYTKESYKWFDRSKTEKRPTRYGGGTGSYNCFKENDYVDDAARAVLGGKWRIPTADEWMELRTNCTWTWTSVNGVGGRRITGPNGNSIFLPAAGMHYLSGNGTLEHYVGTSGYYWSSNVGHHEKTQSTSGYEIDYYWYAKAILFGNKNAGVKIPWSQYRYWGLSIRPVRD